MMPARYYARQGRAMGLARQNHDEVIPCRLFAGPKGHLQDTRGMAVALAQINVTFAGAEHLTLAQLDDGRWLAVTTH